jgi:hypothetical protein
MVQNADSARLTKLGRLAGCSHRLLNSASVSGFVRHAEAIASDDVAGWGAMLAEALQAIGGKLSDN